MNREAPVRAAVEVKDTGITSAVPGSEAEAKSLRETMAEKGHQAALEEAHRDKPLDFGQLDARINESFGHERKADGTKIVTKVEEARRVDAQKQLKRVQEFLEKGGEVSALTDSADRGFVRDIVEHSIYASSPEAATFLDSLSGTEKTAVIDAFVKEPRFQYKLKEVVRSATSTSIEDISLDAVKNRDVTKIKYDVAHTKLSGIDAEIKHINSQLAEYGDTAGVPGVKKVELEKLNKALRSREPLLQAQQDKSRIYSAAVKRLQKDLDDAVTSGKATATIATFQGQLDAAVQVLDDNYREIGVTQKMISDREALLKNQTELNENKLRLEGQKPDASLEDRTAHTEYLSARADYDAAVRDHAQKEMELQLKLGNAFSEASEDLIYSRLSEADAAEVGRLKTESDNALTRIDTVLSQGLLDRWTEMPTRNNHGIIRRRKVLVRKKPEINADFEDLMKNGERALLTKILTSPGTGISQAEIDEKFNKDPDYVAKKGREVGKTLLSHRLKNGKLTEAEAEKVTLSSWGEGLITESLTKNKALDDEIQKAKEEGAIQGHSGREIIDFVIRKHGKKFLTGAIVAAALGTAGLGAGALGVLPLL